jgi:hypothetical protein
MAFGKSMKLLGIVAGFGLLLYCCFKYLSCQIEISKFARIKIDLVELAEASARADLLPEEVPDPWGRSYHGASVGTDEQRIRYWFSTGPDGVTASWGHDPDDINPWTSHEQWIESRFPLRKLELTMAGVGGALLILLVSRLHSVVGRRPPNNTIEGNRDNACCPHSRIDA